MTSRNNSFLITHNNLMVRTDDMYEPELNLLHKVLAAHKNNSVCVGTTS